MNSDYRMRGRRFLNNNAVMSAIMRGAQNSLRLKKNPTATARAAAAIILRAAMLRRMLSNSPTTPTAMLMNVMNRGSVTIATAAVISSSGIIRSSYHSVCDDVGGCDAGIETGAGSEGRAGSCTVGPVAGGVCSMTGLSIGAPQSMQYRASAGTLARQCGQTTVVSVMGLSLLGVRRADVCHVPLLL
jgi:hypothetical protein